MAGSDAPFSAEDLGHPLQDFRPILLVGRIVEGKELDLRQRRTAFWRSEVGSAGILAAVDQKLLSFLAHPVLVEKKRCVRAGRAPDEPDRTRLRRHALGRKDVGGGLAFLLRAPGDVVVGGEGRTALAAFEDLGDELRTPYADRTI